MTVNTAQTVQAMPDLGDIADAIASEVPGTRAGWLVGSIAIGFGNAKSDLDVIAIVAADVDTARLVPWMTVDDKRVDIRSMPMPWVAEQMERLTAWEATGWGEADPSAYEHSSRELALLCRMASGIELPGLDTAEVDAVFDAALVARAACAEELAAAARYLAIARLARLDDDPSGMVEPAVYAIESMVRSRCIASGQHVSSPKWTWPAARRCFGALADEWSAARAGTPADVVAAAEAHAAALGLVDDEGAATLTIRIAEPDVRRFNDRRAAIDPANGNLLWLADRAAQKRIAALIEGAGVDLASLSPADVSWYRQVLAAFDSDIRMGEAPFAVARNMCEEQV